MRHTVIYLTYIAVCCSSKRPAVTRLHLVRRFTRLSPAQYCPAISRSLSNWSSVSILFNLLHNLSMVNVLSKITEAIYQVHLLFNVILHVFM